MTPARLASASPTLQRAARECLQLEEAQRPVPDHGLRVLKPRDEIARPCAVRYRGPSGRTGSRPPSRRVPASGAAATTWSIGSIKRDAAVRGLGHQLARELELVLFDPRACRPRLPRARRNVYAIAPPIRIASTLVSRLRITPILSETLAPPRIATYGCAGLSSHRAQRLELAHHQEARGALARESASRPTVEACARCAVPNASLT